MTARPQETGRTLISESRVRTGNHTAFESHGLQLRPAE